MDFTFVIVTNGDEEFIRSHLQIINVNYVDTTQESEGLMEYELEDLGDGRWKVIGMPSYTAGETYIVKLSGDLRFEDTAGDTLTFSIEAEKKQEMKFNDRIIFIKLPENHEEKGYLVESPEDSDYIYVTLPERGIFTDEYIERIVCVGDYSYMEEFQADPSHRASFGKIEAIMPYQNGSCVLVLTCPMLEEIYDELDVYHYESIDLTDAEIPEDIEEQVVDALYGSEEFSEFVAQAILASEMYAEEYDMTLVTRDAAGILKNIKLKPSIKREDSEFKVSITGTLTIPLKNDDGDKYADVKINQI